MAIVPISRDASTTCISLQDNAIDWERSEKPAPEVIERRKSAGLPPPVLAYQSEQSIRPASWRELVVVRDGVQPTEFIIGVVPASTLTRIEDECRYGKTDERTRELAWRCFLGGLRDIKAGPVTEITGSDGRKTQGVPKKTVDGIEYVDQEWLSRVFVGPLHSVAIEIGLVIWRWNQLGPVDVKN